MSVDTQLQANREALNDFVSAIDGAGPTWTTPRAPGKWSPSQLVEHVARSLDAGANTFAGRPSGFPALPFFLRPVVRGLLFNRVLKKGGFPKAKTNKAMDPESGPETPEAGEARLRSALEDFERECRSCAEKGSQMASPTFGTIDVEDYVRFMELHTRHHLKQMPEA